MTTIETPTTEAAREPRHVVIVDVETSALTPNTQTAGGNLLLSGTPVGVYGVTVEVAWWDLSTGESGCFVPRHHRRHVRAYGSPEALVVCQYLERLVDAEQDDGTKVRELAERLTGNTLAGSSPHFDARFLRPLFERHAIKKSEPWHHRMLDLSNIAAARLGLPFNELPGLAKVCDRLGVKLRDAHTAEGDVRATGECLQKLQSASPQPLIDRMATA